MKYPASPAGLPLFAGNSPSVVGRTDTLGGCRIVAQAHADSEIARPGMGGIARFGAALDGGLGLQRCSVPDSGLSKPVQPCGPGAWRGVFRVGRGAAGGLPVDDLLAATRQPQEPLAGGGARWSRVLDHACSQPGTGPGDPLVGYRVEPAVRALPHGVGVGAFANDALVDALLDHATGAEP